MTSLNDAEARNFGSQAHLSHDARYNQADEFVEAVHGLWKSWEADALILDREREVFADPDKVHALDYQGQWFQAQGPLTVPRTPQGHPVIIQAGQSGRGRDFAARWGELIFAIFPTLEIGAATYADVKSRVEQQGRDPNTVKISPAAYAIVGETETIAQEKLAYIESLARPIDSLVLISEIFNYDFAQHDLDEPIPSETLDGMTGIRSFRDHVVQSSGTPNPSVRDFFEPHGSRHPTGTAPLCRRPLASGGSDGRVVYAPRLRWICLGRDPHAGSLRGFCAAGRPGTATPRLVSYGLRGFHPTG